MTEFKYKGREKEYTKEANKKYYQENKEILKAKQKEYHKLNPWIFEKQELRRKLKIGKISQKEYLREIEEIDKRRGIKSCIQKKESKCVSKEIKELNKKNETLWTDLGVVIARFRKQNIELMNLKEELAILKIDNEELERKLRVVDDRDKPDIDNMINTPSIFGRKQTTIVSKLKKRMDEMALEKEKANAGNISPAEN